MSIQKNTTHSKRKILLICTPTWVNQMHSTKWNKTNSKGYIMWREKLATKGHHKIIWGGEVVEQFYILIVWW